MFLKCSATSSPMKPEFLYHFSEDSSIELFVPRAVKVGPPDEEFVWAVDRAHSHQFYFPRDCPRVVISKSHLTSAKDEESFFGHTTAKAIVAIESRWLVSMRNTIVYRYSLPQENFELRNESAGYWVSMSEVRPVGVEPIVDLMAALVEAEVELRIMPSLVPLRDAVISSTVNFDIIRWRNAAKG